MRVITSGKEPQTRHTCIRCDCVFDYRPKDVQDFWSVTGHGQRYVVCPECDRKAVVSTYFADWKTGKLKEPPDALTPPQKPDSKLDRKR